MNPYLKDFFGLIWRLAVLFIIIAAVGLYILNSPSLSIKTAKKWWNSQHAEDGFELKKLSIERQSFHFPDTFNFTGVAAELGKAYELQLAVDAIDVTGLRGFLQSGKVVAGTAGGLQYSAPNVQLEKGDVKFNLDLDDQAHLRTEGQLQNAKLKLLSYRFDQVRTDFALTHDDIRLTDLNADTYGGLITGEILVNRRPYPSYLARLQLEGLQLGLMDEPMIRSKFQGEVSGYLYIEGRSNAIATVNGVLESPVIQIEAGVVWKLLKLIEAAGTPVWNLIDPDRLERLETAGPFIPFEKAKLELSDYNQETLKASLYLYSRDLNIVLDVQQLDLHVAGGLDGLWHVLDARARPPQPSRTRKKGQGQ